MIIFAIVDEVFILSLKLVVFFLAIKLLGGAIQAHRENKCDADLESCHHDRSEALEGFVACCQAFALCCQVFQVMAICCACLGACH